MDVSALIDSTGIPVAELARKLGVSDGHVWDLKSGRRRLTLVLASKLEEVTGRSDIVSQVVSARIAA